MKRKQIVERIAEERAVPLHTAADWLDSFLHDLIQQLKGLSPEPPDAPDTPPADSKGRPDNPQ